MAAYMLDVQQAVCYLFTTPAFFSAPSRPFSARMSRSGKVTPFLVTPFTPLNTACSSPAGFVG